VPDRFWKVQWTRLPGGEVTPEVRARYSLPLPSMIEGCDDTLLRVLHYPPLSGQEAPGAVRAAAHGDINLLTVLPAATEPGLQVQGQDGAWHDVPCDFGLLIVNIGDMLSRATNDYLPSTTHRVVNPPPERRGVARYSTPFFLHYAPDHLIETLPGRADAENPNRYPTPITADDFLKQRLAEIKLG
jgi:isopenicillin N synthase-like dioxygenase